MSGLYTRTGTQLRVRGNGDAKEANKAVCIAKSWGQQRCEGSIQGSVHMNEEHRINTGSEFVTTKNNKVCGRVIPKWEIGSGLDKVQC